MGTTQCAAKGRVGWEQKQEMCRRFALDWVARYEAKQSKGMSSRRHSFLAPLAHQLDDYWCGARQPAGWLLEPMLEPTDRPPNAYSRSPLGLQAAPKEILRALAVRRWFGISPVNIIVQFPQPGTRSFIC